MPHRPSRQVLIVYSDGRERVEYRNRDQYEDFQSDDTVKIIPVREYCYTEDGYQISYLAAHFNDDFEDSVKRSKKHKIQPLKHKLY